MQLFVPCKWFQIFKYIQIYSNYLGDDGVVVEERITDGTSGPWCSLPCRSIRIGNYKASHSIVIPIPSNDSLFLFF